MTLALIDYGAGNLHSVHNALKAAGAVDVRVTADPDIVAHADRVVLPGVGAFAHCMAALSGIDGMIAAMEQRYQRSKIQESGHRIETQIYSGERPIIGLNAALSYLQAFALVGSAVRQPACGEQRVVGFVNQQARVKCWVIGQRAARANPDMLPRHVGHLVKQRLVLNAPGGKDVVAQCLRHLCDGGRRQRRHGVLMTESGFLNLE